MTYRLSMLFAVLAVSCAAGDVRLEWDASPDKGVTNYVLYANPKAFPAKDPKSATVRMDVGTNLFATVKDVSGLWTFAVTAMADGMESELSNVLAVDIKDSTSISAARILQSKRLSVGAWKRP